MTTFYGDNIVKMPASPDDHLLPGDRVFIDTVGGWKYMDTKAIYLKSRTRKSFEVFKNYPVYLHWIEVEPIEKEFTGIVMLSDKTGWYADYQVILAPVQRSLI